MNYIPPSKAGATKMDWQYYEFWFLARLFSKETLRYCHSLVVVGGVIVVQKLLQFLISLSLLKIFTIKRGTHVNRAGNSRSVLT